MIKCRYWNQSGTKNKANPSSIRMLQYLAEIMDTGLLMLAALALTPMPGYVK